MVTMAGLLNMEEKMSNKRKIVLSILGVVIGTALLIASAVLTENELITPALAVLFVSISVAFLFTAIFYAAKVEYEISVYECRKCGNIFKPTFKAYIMGAHSLATRHLKCPECKEKSWCKRKTNA